MSTSADDSSGEVTLPFCINNLKSEAYELSVWARLQG